MMPSYATFLGGCCYTLPYPAEQEISCYFQDIYLVFETPGPRVTSSMVDFWLTMNGEEKERKGKKKEYFVTFASIFSVL